MNVSLPTGAVTLMLHWRPVSVVAQFGDPVVSATTVAAPPFTPTLADFVFDETYCGVRDPVLAFCCGTVMLNRAVPFRCACVAAGVGLDEPPPPQPASMSKAAKAITKARNVFKASP